MANLTACYHALNAEGLVDVAAGSARNLSTAERLKVTRVAQAGHVDQAIGEYLRCALDARFTGGHSRKAVPGAITAAGRWPSSHVPATVRDASVRWKSMAETQDATMMGM